MEPALGAAALSSVCRSSLRPRRGDIRDLDFLAASFAVAWMRLEVDASDWRDGWRLILEILRLAVELIDWMEGWRRSLLILEAVFFFRRLDALEMRLAMDCMDVMDRLAADWRLSLERWRWSDCLACFALGLTLW